MSEKHFIKFYPGDYLRDTGELSAIEHGVYLLFLSHIWSKGVQIPSDSEKIYKIARAHSEEERSAAISILENPTLFEKNEFGYSNKRAMEEFEKRKRSYEAAKANGRKGGRPKKDTDVKTQKKPNPFDSLKQNESYPEPEPEPDTSCSKEHSVAPSCEELKSKNEYEKKLQASGNINMHNTGWVPGLIAGAIDEIRKQREITDDTLLSVWSEVCADAAAKSVTAPKWYRTVFVSRSLGWSPAVASAQRAGPYRGQGSQIPGNQIVKSEDREGGILEI